MNENLQILAEKSENKMYNKTAIICQTILDSVIALAYILEVVKGNRSLLYGLLVVAFCYVPVVLAIMVYRKNPKSELALMRIIGIGFTALYTLVLFTAANDLVFTYAMPMLIILLVYNKKRFVIIIGLGAFIENVLAVIINIVVNHRTAASDIVTYEIQVLLILMCAIFFIVISGKFTEATKIREARVTIEKNKINDLFEKTVEVSGQMIGNVELVDSKMETLNASMENTLNSMSEVSTGTNETAMAIQNQLLKTEQIQDTIEAVENAVDMITDDMSKTINAVDDGKMRVESLTALSAKAEKAGNEVAASLDSFTEYTNKMNSITELIDSVASQTSLLALNASIEAARAGEAGRGFAVVASEISNLAGQTSSATADINELIGNISSQLSIMVDKIDTLIVANKEQGETAGKTAESFVEINTNIDEVKSQAAALEKAVAELASANKEIVDSIQTISAITEEVSAHSGETYNASESNQAILDEVGAIVAELKAEAEELK